MYKPKLLAYIPTLNQRHIEWFKRHPGSELLLIAQVDAERLLPRLARNMAAIPTDLMMRMISVGRFVSRISIFETERNMDWLMLPDARKWILPDEDVTNIFAEKHLLPHGCEVAYEMIWARYDMKIVLEEQLVISDIEISTEKFARDFIRTASIHSERSSDWWRQVGALLATPEGEVFAVTYNTHMPNEYETYLFGDPSLNRDAGQRGKSVALHAEEAAIDLCARYGHRTDGAYIYVTTFPCEGCANRIAYAGIKKVFFRDGYSSLNAQEVFRTWGVEIIQVK